MQPFRRDYQGISGKTAEQIDGTHQTDWQLWKYIDPYADFYVASIYVFYDRPDSVFYMAANVEENFQRTRAVGDKPVYAFQWLRFHNSNWWLKNTELPPYLVEAMAILPFFSGAKGIVLWGWEPEVKASDPLPYEQMPLYMESLQRVAGLSDKIGRARLVIDDPAHVLWKSKRPLVRLLKVGEGECVVMAINPWQSASDQSLANVTCDGRTVEVTMRGTHTTLMHVDRNKITQH